MKPLDIIRTPDGGVGMVTEVSSPMGSRQQASVVFMCGQDNDSSRERRFAWWYEDEFEIIDNIPRLLAHATATTHRPRDGKNIDVERAFGLK